MPSLLPWYPTDYHGLQKSKIIFTTFAVHYAVIVKRIYARNVGISIQNKINSTTLVIIVGSVLHLGI